MLIFPFFEGRIGWFLRIRLNAWASQAVKTSHMMRKRVILHSYTKLTTSTPWIWRIKALGGFAILMDVASIILYCNELVTTFLVSLQWTSFMSKRVEQVFYRVNHPVVLAACSLLSFKLERTRSHPGDRFCQNAADSLCESNFPLTILDWGEREPCNLLNGINRRAHATANRANISGCDIFQNIISL